MNSFTKLGKLTSCGFIACATFGEEAWSRCHDHDSKLDVPFFVQSTAERHFSVCGIKSLVHNGRGVWGSDFGSCSYVLMRSSPRDFNGRFLRLFAKQGSVASNEELERRFHTATRASVLQDIEFKKIPGSPVAYWVNEQTIGQFSRWPSLSELGTTRLGMTTANNDLFTRQWHEIHLSDFLHSATCSQDGSITDPNGCRTTRVALSESGTDTWMSFLIGGMTGSKSNIMVKMRAESGQQFPMWISISASA